MFKVGQRIKLINDRFKYCYPPLKAGDVVRIVGEGESRNGFGKSYKFEGSDGNWLDVDDNFELDNREEKLKRILNEKYWCKD